MESVTGSRAIQQLESPSVDLQQQASPSAVPLAGRQETSMDEKEGAPQKGVPFLRCIPRLSTPLELKITR